MRYLNWDVLLFPNTSKVPTQEFRTACYVVHDTDACHDDYSPISSTQGYVKQLPVVSSFVAKEDEGSPFRVSIHSWESPQLSPSQKIHENAGRVAAFEIKVIIDGTLSGVDIVEFCSDSPALWPRVIDASILPDKHGNPEGYLAWPKFHKEMLTNVTWSAAESLGRIKVIIAEGYKVDTGTAAPFMKLKNIIAFAFQHAPQSTLENAGIAWPNRAMWMGPTSAFVPGSSPSKGLVTPSLHSHSPHDRQLSRSYQSDTMSIDQFNPNQFRPLQLPGPEISFQSLATASWAGDPFVDSRRRMSQRESDQTDVSMPDWPLQHTRHQRQHSSEMSLTYNRNYCISDDISYTPSGKLDSGRLAHLDGHLSRENSLFSHGELGCAQALVNTPVPSPEGIHVPNNTRANSALSTPRSETTQQATPNGRNAAQLLASFERAGLLDEKPQPIAGMKPPPKTRAQRNPSTTIKSRKEAKAKADSEVPVAHVDQRKPSYGNELYLVVNNPLSVETKRKRSHASIVNEGKPQTRSICLPESNHQSPLRKVSKTDETSPTASNSNLSTPEGGVRIQEADRGNTLTEPTNT